MRSSEDAGDPAAQFVVDLATLRREYGSAELTEGMLAADWLAQLRGWYAIASADERISDPNAMQVATADALGRPDVRTVLARGFDEAGVVFYTNYRSAKARQLDEQPHAAALFAWLPLQRQVRLRGPVTKVSPDETAAYFASRPRGAQLAAWASPQSEPVPGRAELDRRFAEAVRRFGADGGADGPDEPAGGGGPIPPPPFWGGYRIAVTEVEFWQGRDRRLHDRLRYRLDSSGGWLVERLAP